MSVMLLWLRTLLGLVFVVGLTGPGWGATDLAAMQPAEIQALQKRLTDDGCYAGPIDGQASGATSEAVKACPDQSPTLRIETGMHVLNIQGIAVDEACHLAVTGSEDKTVRVWSLPDGQLQRTIRPPINNMDGGKIYAVALSADGRTAAASGRDAYGEEHRTYAISLFDPLTGGSMRRVGTFGYPVFHLAFSPDGSRLAAALGDNGADVRVSVFDVGSGRQLMNDPDYPLGSTAIAFGPDGSLYAMGGDGDLRHYGRDLKRLARVKVPGPSMTLGNIAIDRTGTRLAIAYAYESRINLLDAHSLNVIGQADSNNIGGGLQRASRRLPGPVTESSWLAEAPLTSKGIALSGRSTQLAESWATTDL